MSTEFNSNITPNVVPAAKAQPTAGEEQKDKPQVQEQPVPQSDAVPVGQAAVAGKSQVAQPDSVKKDIAFMGAHPEIVNMATQVFEGALKHYEDEGEPEEAAYVKACMAMNQFKREMCEKQS